MTIDDDVDEAKREVGRRRRDPAAARTAVRDPPAFSRFLQVSALRNATLVRFTAVSNDAQVPRTTLCECFRVLSHFLEAHWAGEYRWRS